MGNDLKSEISKKINEMKDYINSFKYEKTKDIYENIKSELIKIEKEDDINEIANYLILSHTKPIIGNKFNALITNLRPKDKLIYLFKLIYENELAESIDKNEEKNSLNSLLFRKEKSDKNNYEKMIQDINIKMNRILTVDKYIDFLQFKSLMFEKIAEKYFNLGSLMYSNYSINKNLLSTELQEVVNLFTQCIENYKKTGNQKIKLEEYNASLERVLAHQNVLRGREYIRQEKYEDALKCFNQIKINVSNIVEEKNKGIYFCYEKLAEIKEEEKNYVKAIEYYMLINNNFKIYELNIKINEILIISCIKEKKFENTFTYFKTIFDLVNKAQNKEFIELKFSKIFIIFIELIIKIAIISYQNNNLKYYIETLENIKAIIENEEINSEVKQLLLELRMLEKNKENVHFDYIKNLPNLGNSEIKQRFNLSLLILKYFKKDPFESLSILLRKDIKLEYMTSDSFIMLISYLKEKNDLDDLFLISKLIYKIIVSVGLFQRIEYFNIIGVKIQEIIKIPNIEKDAKYNDVMEYLILSFQEIMINNSKINNYESPKKVIRSLILKSNQFIITISRSLLFLSLAGVILEKDIIDIIASYLKKNENDNLLQTLFAQCQLNVNIIYDYLNSIYNILFNYQKINIKNKNEKIEKIFMFLMSLPDELIASRTSIVNLEKYITHMEINPLCYKLIEKIPIANRSIKLTSILAKYNEIKILNNLNIEQEDIKYLYDYLSSITKDDLPQLEKNLDDLFYVEKLIYYLKNQKFLFNYLNLEEISKHFSSKTKELFNLLIDNEIKFEEKALCNLLDGFYKNSEREIKETFILFNKIKQYQVNFPFAIEVNLKIEEFLNKKEYDKIKQFDIKLNEIFNDFSYLNGFANQHKKFILYLLKLADPEKRNEIYKKMMAFLVEKFFDIGKDIYEEILNNVDQKEFIKMIQTIFSTKKISIKIKQKTKEKLYYYLIEADNKIELIKSFKFFIDFIILPDELLEYLISFLENEIDNRELYNEIIFVLGIYFSTNKKKQQGYLNIIIGLISEKEIYKYIFNVIKNLISNNEILYLYSCLNYINFNTNIPKSEKEILEIPINIIVNIIKSINIKFNRKLFFENLNHLNLFYKYDIFSPQRDKIIRKLYFNNKNNSLTKLILICSEN